MYMQQRIGPEIEQTVVGIPGIAEGAERIPGRKEGVHIEERTLIAQERHTVEVAAGPGTSAVHMARSQRWRIRCSGEVTTVV